MRIIAIIAIVMIHVVNPYLLSCPSYYEFKIANMIETLSHFAVPFFIFISGTFMEERLDASLHIKYKDTYLKYVDITDTIRLKQSDIKKQKEELKEVKTMNRKEISNVKLLHPWRKTNSLFFKKRKF